MLLLLCSVLNTFFFFIAKRNLLSFLKIIPIDIFISVLLDLEKQFKS